MGRPSHSTRKRADPGADKARARLERKHARLLRQAFAKTLAVIVPTRASRVSLTPEAVVGRLRDRQGIIRNTVAGMLTEAVLLGAAHGWDDVERAMGIRTNAIVTANAVLGITWDLIHAAALDWVLTGNGPAGLPDWGTGYGGANSLTAQIVRTSEGQIRATMAAWMEAGEPTPVLIDRLEAVTFNRRRAMLIAVTETTRAYALGNILAWQQSGVIDRMAWQCARDERVCRWCFPLQGATAPVGSSFRSAEGRLVGPPPAHPACRCWLTAVVD